MHYHRVMPRKISPVTKFAHCVLDRLHQLSSVRMRPMFGGYGFYHASYFFGLVWQDTFYLFTDTESRKKYKRAGMGPFVFKEGQREGNYFAVPDTVLADPKKLAKWAEESIECRKQFEHTKPRP